MTVVASRRPAPPRNTVSTLRRLFGSPLNIALTVLVIGILALAIPPMLRWAVLDAAFLPAVPQTCQDITGACWSFVIAKYSQILFGIYPDTERWRPALVSVVLLGLLLWSVRPAAWKQSLVFVWVGVMLGSLLLMRGGFGGLPLVQSANWGGLPVTLILTVIAIGVGFPMAVGLALARRSALPAVSALSTLFIEATRAMPLLSILFIASIMLPLLLPDALLPDKFVRAAIALLLFAAAYMAEVIRGGLQSLPPGQTEAGAALGMTWWQVQRDIVLPQAIVTVIPALTNTIIVMIKNTSLVLVVGIFDLISSGKSALADPMWRSPATETYLFIGLIYFSLCFGFSRFAQSLEQRTRVPRA